MASKSTPKHPPVHVIFNSRGEWIVIVENSSRARSVSSTKAGAMKTGNSFCYKHQATLVVHNKNGSVTQKQPCIKPRSKPKKPNALKGKQSC